MSTTIWKQYEQQKKLLKAIYGKVVEVRQR